MLEIGNSINRDKIEIDQKKIERHAVKFPSLVEIVLNLWQDSITIDLCLPGVRSSTIRSYKPKLSPYVNPEDQEESKRHRGGYQKQFKKVKETARKEYDQILRKVKEGKYILHIYDDGRVELKLT